MHLSRRAIIAVPLAVTLAGCAGTTLTPSQIVADAATLAKGLAGALTAVASAVPNLLPAGMLATLESDLTLAEGAASALNTNLPATSGASIAQTIDGYINAVLNTLAAPPLNGLIPAPFNTAIAAAAVVVPEIEAFVNRYLPTASAVAPATYAARLKLRDTAPQVTTLAQALAILEGYAGA